MARNRYIKQVEQYNVLIRQFPVNLTAMVFSYQTKANFSVENERAIATPPAVNFDKPVAPPPPTMTSTPAAPATPPAAPTAPSTPAAPAAPATGK